MSKRIQIERVVMSGRGPRITYKLTQNGKTLFQSGEHGGYYAWTLKRDAQRVLNAIEAHGLAHVEEQLNRKA